jgi:hypothetical protein
MDKRQKILAGAVLVLLAYFILEGFVITPWSEAMAAAEKDVQRLRSDVRSSKAKVEMEPDVAKEWKALKDRLTAVKSEEASNLLATAVEAFIRKHDLKKSALSPEPPVPLVGGAAFREHLLTLTFQCSWDAFVKLLLDLYTADEFVRIARIGVQSHYLTEKESHLDVTLRLSAVSAAPPGGGK